MDEKLTNAEQLELAEYEATIERILGAYYETGRALLKIQDERLYRAMHATFAEYCRERWEIKKTHAYRLIEAARVVENLSPIGDIPATESQARELAGLAPDEQRKVWQKALETAPSGLITAAHIRETRESLFGSPSEPVQETLFDLDDYRRAIKYHVDAANHHIRRATHYRKQAFNRYHVQIPLPFEFTDEREEQ